MSDAAVSRENRDDVELDQRAAGDGLPGDAGEANEERGIAAEEGGRILGLDPAPEEQLLHEGTVTERPPAALAPDQRQAEQLRDIDDRAAEDAKLEVRRREHSADSG